MTSTLLAEQSDSPVTPQRVLEDVFGYQEFRDGQQLVIDAAVEGRDSLVILPTGGGKSLCYQIPALDSLWHYFGHFSAYLVDEGPSGPA